MTIGIQASKARISQDGCTATVSIAVSFLQRGGRKQIPMHRVAECFVDANSVLVNCKSLRCARNRRCDKPAKLHVRLEWISRHFTDNDARHIFLQGIRNVQRLGALDLIYVNYIDACWNLFDIYAGTRT